MQRLGRVTNVDAEALLAIEVQGVTKFAHFGPKTAKFIGRPQNTHIANVLTAMQAPHKATHTTTPKRRFVAANSQRQHLPAGQRYQNLLLRLGGPRS